MSTITTILGTDLPKDSRAVINTNFTNLNSTKKEDSMSTNKLLGRNTAGIGVIEEITLGTNLSMTGTTLNVTGGAGDMVLAAAQTNSGLKTFLDTTFGLRNVANTFTGVFTNAITAARTWTLPDKNGTVAMTSDITGTNSGTNTGDETTGRINTLYGTTNAITVGSVELGNASDTTISRVSAGKIAVESVNVGTEGILQNSQSAAYTTVLLDAGKHIYHPSADTTARTWTIDSNANVAYPIGTAITFINDTSAGTLTIAITSDTMILAGTGTTGSRTLTANGIATAVKITSTRWIINGTNLT